MAYRNSYIFNIIYKNINKKMNEGFIVGILLFGLLIYGIATGFDDGNEHDNFN